VQQQQDSLITG